MSRWPTGSRPEVGSSSTSNWGSGRAAWAMPRRWSMPRERALVRACCLLARSVRRSIRSTASASRLQCMPAQWPTAEAEQDPEQGGLAGPVLADKPEDVSGPNYEVGVFQRPGGRAALALADSGGLQDLHRVFPSLAEEVEHRGDSHNDLNIPSHEKGLQKRFRFRSWSLFVCANLMPLGFQAPVPALRRRPRPGRQSGAVR